MIAITITLARDQHETKNVLSGLRELSRNASVIAADGGSCVDALRAMAEIDKCRVVHCDAFQPARLTSQVRTAFRHLPGLVPDYVLYTEPDKAEFFRDKLKSFLSHKRSAGLILAARTQAAFNSLPEGQRITEGLINDACSVRFGMSGDYCYGPLLIRKDLLPYISRVEESFGWGWRFFLMGLSMRLGLGIQLIADDYPLPRDPETKSEIAIRRYRLQQLLENTTGLAAAYLASLDK